MLMNSQKVTRRHSGLPVHRLTASDPARAGTRTGGSRSPELLEFTGFRIKACTGLDPASRSVLTLLYFLDSSSKAGMTKEGKDGFLP
jgi:hypothetical protein